MKRKMTKARMVWHAAGSVVLLFAACTGAFSGAYLLTRWFYASHEVSWSDFVVQLVNWGLGIAILLLTALIVNFFVRPKERVFWNETIEALRRIAKGDFNVVIDQEGKYHGQIGEFIESINEMTQELKQVDKLRQQFVSDVSHEIQSPLTSIRGFANTLQREDLTRGEQRHYLSIIEKETVRLSRLSDNLMKLATLESDPSDWPMARYWLDSQLEQIVLSCEPQWLEKRQDIELDTTPCEIVGNEELMSQVWLNLIHNAVKFTPEDGSIRIALTMKDGHAAVEIADTGIGIAPEDQNRIFERFFKGDKQRTRTTDGSGLGLSIVKRIVELHGGSILVRSAIGEGTTFEVGLPPVKKPI